MVNGKILVSTIMIFGLCVALSPSPSVGQSRETFEKWMTQLSNWGRWGKDDQLGTINLITPDKQKQAAALIKDGISISLSRDAMAWPAFDNAYPVEIEDHSDSGNLWETFKITFHGLSHITHVDGLAHHFYDGKMYNGFPQPGRLPSYSGLGVENLKNGIFTRGILIDIPRLRGLPYLEPGTVVRCEELDAWLKKVNLKVAPGDALFLRTGRWAFRAEHEPHALAFSGLDVSCAKWLKERDVAILGSDFANEVYNAEVEKSWPPGDRWPFHKLALVAMGMPLIDQCDLEKLAEEAAKRQRWEFLFVAAPLAVPGASGSPMNPLAVF